MKAQVGVLYIMTTAVSGLIKIGISESKQYEERMRHLKFLIRMFRWVKF